MLTHRNVISMSTLRAEIDYLTNVEGWRPMRYCPDDECEIRRDPCPFCGGTHSEIISLRNPISNEYKAWEPCLDCGAVVRV